MRKTVHKRNKEEVDWSRWRAPGWAGKATALLHGPQGLPSLIQPLRNRDQAAPRPLTPFGFRPREIYAWGCIATRNTRSLAADSDAPHTAQIIHYHHHHHPYASIEDITYITLFVVAEKNVDTYEENHKLKKKEIKLGTK